MKWQTWLAFAALWPLAGGAASVESAPCGLFTLDTRSLRQGSTTVGLSEVAAGRALWDVTGAYATTVSGDPLSLDLVHDAKGRVTGTATLTVNTGTALVPVTMPIRGSVRGSAGVLAVTLALEGADAARTVRVSLSFRLALEPVARQLTGTVSGSRTANGTTTPVPSQPVTLAIPAPMDGTWTLRLDLVLGDRSIRGTALLTLSNGVGYVHTVGGTYADQAAILTLSGRPGYPALMGSRITTTLAPLEGAPPQMTAFSGTFYGQTIAW